MESWFNRIKINMYARGIAALKHVNVEHGVNFQPVDFKLVLQTSVNRDRIQHVHVLLRTNQHGHMSYCTLI